jgi:transcriptional regulator with PAS, ATPase and Fis domain
MSSNRREAAAILGISVRSLQYKIKKYLSADIT